MGVGMATAAIVGLGVASAGMQVAAGNKQAKAIEKQAAWNSQVYDQQASMIQEQKKIQGIQSDRAIARARSSIIARTAGKGLNLSGSPLAVMIDNETQMLFDQAINDYNSQVNFNYAKSGANYYRESGREQSRLARFTGYSNAFSTLLSTGANAGMMNMGGANPSKINTSSGTGYRRNTSNRYI